MKDLETPIHQTPCDLVLVATPINLTRLISISQPALRVIYRIEDRGEPSLTQIMDQFIREKNLKGQSKSS